MDHALCTISNSFTDLDIRQTGKHDLNRIRDGLGIGVNNNIPFGKGGGLARIYVIDVQFDARLSQPTCNAASHCAEPNKPNFCLFKRHSVLRAICFLLTDI